MKYTLRLILCSMFFINCSDNSNRSQLLNTDPLNIDLAKKDGFEKVEEIDVLLFKKQIGDTLVSLEFDDLFQKNYLKNWKFKLEFDNIKEVRNTLLDYGLIPVTGVSHWDNDTGYSLTLIRNLDNNIFICDVRKEEDSSYLSLSYHIPSVNYRSN